MAISWQPGARSTFQKSPLIIGIFLACLLPACGQQTAVSITPSSTPTHLPGATTTLVPSPTATITPARTITPTSLSPSPTPGPWLCSPLEDVALQELPGIIAGDTYQPPLPGRDDGHPGVDFAFYRRGSRTTMLGLPVRSALAGKVAAVIPDRKPYGNTVIIETPLESLPAVWSVSLTWPTLAPTVVPDARLTCPLPLTLPAWDSSKRSLYLLYAHLNQPSPLRVGDTVICGQVVGEVGTTGASVNPHLHFEARLGPSGMTLTSIGHYDNRTTAEERNNYCLWRVSQWFQLVDPLKILSQAP